MNNSDGDLVTKRKPWTRVVLFASLALNLLIVGAIGGMVVRGGPGRMGGGEFPPPLRDLGYGVFGHALSQDDRRSIGQEMVKHSGDLNANRREIRTRVDGLLTALRADPYDAAQVQQLITQQQAQLLKRQQIGQDLLLDQIGKMSVKDRTEFAKRLERLIRRSRQ
jgi:uncharacterized membrane protein